MDTIRRDSKSPTQIVADIERHFDDRPAFKDRDELIELFLEAFAQDPMTNAEPVPDEGDDAPAEADNV